jgi:NAD(P)-dependent dehydrogenase (short-subunit alcohol dehydrogenase family)
MGVMDGKVAIVTGAGHGVGRGHALDLAEAGAKVVVNDLGGAPSGGGADHSPADEVVELIRSRGGEAAANYDDVSDFDAARSMVRQAVDTFGGLDALILNAGILRDKMIFNMDENDWDAVVKVHLKGHFAPTRHATEYWREKSKEIGGPVKASVVCTGSSVGLLGNVGQTNYSAAKGGIAMFTIALANDMERYGVRSNMVAPSGNTRLIATIPGRDAAVLEPEQYEQWDPTNPGNVAPLVVYLASDLSAHVTGQIFMSWGAQILHFAPWTPDVSVTVPGGDKKWTPEEIAVALNTSLYKSRHPGLRASMEGMRKM